MAVEFYAVKDKYGEFSNFAAFPFELDGKRWPTSEHYFQAQKFAGTPHEEEIRLAKSPMIAARLGRSRKVPLREDWESVKDDIMRRAVVRKFESYAKLQSLLLDTGDETLIEKTTQDYYWGCGTNRTGKNRLGTILMEVRAMLRERLASEKAAARGGR